MKNRRSKVVFKSYNQNQLLVLPPSLEELIEPNHPVRVVNEVIDSINATPLMEQYQGGGTSSYHPKMMLKVLIYSYLSNIYSSRKMECALKENIHFMWLSGMSRPDHNTLNRFRSERLKDVLKEIFAQVVLLLVDSGHVLTRQIAGHNLKNKLGLIKFGHYGITKTKIYARRSIVDSSGRGTGRSYKDIPEVSDSAFAV